MATEDSAPARDTTNRDLAPLVFPAIVALAFVLRTTMAIRTSVMFEDGPHFLDIAKSFARGDFSGALSHPYHPLYSGLTALVHALVQDWEVAALCVSVVGGTVAVVASFVLLRDAFDPRVAAFATFLFAISPYAVRFTSDVQSEGVYLAFFLAALALLFRGLERAQAPVLFAASISAGLAYLARPEGAGVVVVGAALLVRASWKRELQSREALKMMGALSGGALLVAAPYLFVLAQGESNGMLSGKKGLLRTFGLAGEAGTPFFGGVGNLPWFGLALLAAIAALLLLAMFGPGARRGKARRRGRVTLIACAFVLVVGLLRWPHELEEFIRVGLSTLRPEVAVLVALGLYAASQENMRERDHFVAAVMLLYGAVLIGLLVNYGYLSRRHVLPLVPLALGYAGLGAVWLVEFVSTAAPKLLANRPPVARLAGLGLLMFAIAAPKTLHDHRAEALAQRVAAEWLRDEKLGPGRVASHKRRTGHYADRGWHPLTEEGALRSFERLMREHVRFIVADDHMLGHRNELLATPGFELRELHRVTTRGRSAAVYELRRAPAVANVGVGAAATDHETR